MHGIEETNTIVHYQWLLRIIGRYLDEHAARTVALFEGPGGFEVVYGTEPASPDVVAARFPRDQLQIHRDEMLAEFQQGSRRPSGRYEDAFRALGYELERQHAYYILIAELEEGFLVTYQYLNPAQSYMVRKQMAVLDPSDGEQLLVEARARRVKGQLPRRSLRELFK